MGKAITMNTEPSELYAAGLPQSLVNGVLNEDQDAAAGEWMAWISYTNSFAMILSMSS